MKRAIVTLVVGKSYESMFNLYCKNNWKRYCEKYNYDLIVINDFLDISKKANERSVAWQKLLILSQEWSKNYDQIVWIDSDVVINSEQSKDIACLVESEYVGAVEAYSIPSKELYHLSMKRQYDNWRGNNIVYLENLEPGQYYKNRGIPGENLNHVVQTGVFVCSTNNHKELFEHIYYSYNEKSKDPSWNYEMPAMSYELINSNLIKWLPIEYNYCVLNIISAYYPFVFFKRDLSLKSRFLQKLRNKILTRLQIDCLEQIYNNGYFIHFAGCQNWIRQFKGIK